MGAEVTIQPFCYVCQDEGWCLWDDDQCRYREASFLWSNRKAEPEPCQECSKEAKYPLKMWYGDYGPGGYD